jgi:dephospho-CoA kinase
MIDRLAKFGIPVELPKIGLVGLSRTGKGTAAKYLEENFGFASFTMSDVIREYAKANDITLSRKPDFWATRNRMNEIFGEDYLLAETLKNLGLKYQAYPEQVKGIVIDGIRDIRNALNLKDLPTSLLLALISNDELRHQRKRTERPEDFTKFADFLADEADERTIIEPIYPHAFAIINNGPEDHFKKLIRTTVMTQFGQIR